MILSVTKHLLEIAHWIVSINCVLSSSQARSDDRKSSPIHSQPPVTITPSFSYAGSSPSRSLANVRAGPCSYPTRGRPQLIRRVCDAHTIRMSYEWAPKFGNMVSRTTMSDCLKLFLCTGVQTKESLDALTRSGWCIMSTWIEAKNMCKDGPGYVSNISFGIGKRGSGSARL